MSAFLCLSRRTGVCLTSLFIQGGSNVSTHNHLDQVPIFVFTCAQAQRDQSHLQGPLVLNEAPRKHKQMKNRQTKSYKTKTQKIRSGLIFILSKSSLLVLSLRAWTDVGEPRQLGLMNKFGSF